MLNSYNSNLNYFKKKMFSQCKDFVLNKKSYTDYFIKAKYYFPPLNIALGVFTLLKTEKGSIML